MKKIIYLSLLVLSMTGFASCDDSKSHEPNPDEPSVSYGAFFLNQGNFYSHIDGALSALNYNTGTMNVGAFKKANGFNMGDTPQCGICYGNKIYLGIYESNMLYVLDKSTFRVISSLSLKDAKNGQSPRSMAATGGKVYVAMYDGYVARMDTVSMVIDKSVKVGPNPELIGIYGNCIYVPNSDGMNYPNYGKTATVIDIPSFTVSGTLTVPENPYQFKANRTGLYLLCKGNYVDQPARIYKVEGMTCNPVADATIMALTDSRIYYINDPYYGAQPAEYKIYDPSTGNSSDWKIEKVDYPNNIAIDEIGGRIFIASYIMDGKYPSYSAPGYVNEYTLRNQFVKKYDIAAGPTDIFFDQD